MIRLFRKVRQKLLSENSYGMYILYATGEIVLVMIGILLALQVDSAISIYPNPVVDYLNVKIMGDQLGEAFIELYDPQGRQIQNWIDKYPGTHTLEISTLKAGLYMARISMDGKYLSSRRIIKR